MIPAASDSTLVFTKDYIFHSIQGEGKFTGVPSVFVRLAGCNLRCAWKNQDGSLTRCDTPYSSYLPEDHLASIEATVSQLHAFQCRHVIVTGGEPFFQKNVVILIEKLVALGHYVTVETNGTIYWPNQAQFLSISPKLSSSLAWLSSTERFAEAPENIADRINFSTLAQMVSQDHQLKFIVHDETDIAEIRQILEQLRVRVGTYDDSNVYLMPQALSIADLDARSRWVIEICKKYHWRFCDRLHIRLWGNQRAI